MATQRGTAFWCGVLALGPTSAAALTVRLVSNEGQQPAQAVDHVRLIAHPGAPAAPDEPSDDAAGLPFSDARYRETDVAAPLWTEAIPVWRDPAWPTTGLPLDAGAVGADWLWGSALDPSLLDALLFPDAGGDTRFPRRFSALRGNFENGVIPGARDAAAFFRRTFCLPLNLDGPAGARLALLADSQARLWVDGALAHDSCPGPPAACASSGVPSFANPSDVSFSLGPGAHALGLGAWSWQPGAVLGGVLYQLELTYGTTAADLAVGALGVTPTGLRVTVRAWSASRVPAGAVLAVVSEGKRVRATLPAFAAVAMLDLPLPAPAPGALVTATADAEDYAGHEVGGALNAFGGGALPDGAFAARGMLVEPDEDDDVAQLRLPPALDLALDGAEVASASALLAGASRAGTHVFVRRGDTVAAEADASADGRFVATVTLARGANHFTASAAADGVESARSAAVTVTLAPDPPAPPVILSPAPDAVLETFAVDVRGTGATAARLTLTLDGRPACEQVVAAGAWACVVTATEGPHLLEGRQRSRAGLDSLATAPVTFRVVPPTGPVDAGAPDAGPTEPPDAGATPADAGLEADAGEGPVTPGPPRYAARGGGGCTSLTVGWLALLPLFALGRRRRLGLLALLLAARSATALEASPGPFEGRVPFVGAAAGPAGRATVALSFAYARDPVVLFDLRSGHRVSAIVQDRLVVQASATFSLHRRLALGLAMPWAPLHRGDALPDGLPAAAPGVGDLAGALLVVLQPDGPFRAGLELGATAPLATGAYLGAGRATAAARLVTELEPVAWLTFALAAGVRTSPVPPAVLEAPAPAPLLGLRAGALLDAGGVLAPFVALQAEAPLAAGVAASQTPVRAVVGTKVATGGGFELSFSAGRGLRPAHPAVRRRARAHRVPHRQRRGRRLQPVAQPAPGAERASLPPGRGGRGPDAGHHRRARRHAARRQQRDRGRPGAQPAVCRGRVRHSVSGRLTPRARRCYARALHEGHG